MLILAVVLGLLVVGGIVLYNRMVAMRRLVENAWSDVDVFLKRRAELVPSLVSTVRAAAEYEQETLERVAEARLHALAARDVSVRGAAETDLTAGLARTLAIAEATPALKANESFLQLQESLIETERHVADARRYYNACVRDFNTMIEVFPGVLIARQAGFRPREFFEIESLSERLAPQVGEL